jgi:lysyl endopeptidase
MKYFIFLSSIILGGVFAHTQVDARFLPPNQKDKVSACTAEFVAPKVNNQLELTLAKSALLLEGDKMLRFGKELAVNLDFKSMAQRFVQPNGRTIYQLGISCPTAKSINLILDNFYLAEDARLFLTDKFSGKFIGAYTHANNNEAEVLGTELLKSEFIYVVLDEPTNVTNASRFQIQTVVHGFDDLEELAKGLNTSGQCHYDVNCPLGTGYEMQRNSVAMLVNGGGFCTGSLVHNTSGTIKPYFISARHCGTNPTNWVFRFRWEAPSSGTSCATTSPSVDGPATMNVNGAVLMAQNSNSDFLLVLLNANPNPSWGVYYNGWDNTDNQTATQGIGIHHPDGDLKKISIDENSLGQQTINFQGAQNNVWLIQDWDYGTTEPGSSGSPLFNQEKRLIGVLSGGTAACNGTIGNGEADFYGRFGFGWDNASSASGRLKDWLDSANTGATIIDGVDPLIGNDLVDASLSTLTGFPDSRCDSVATPQFLLINSGLNNLTQVDFTYGFVGMTQLNYTWTGNLPTYGQATIILPNINLPLGNSDFQINVINSNGTSDIDISNNKLTSSFLRLQPDFEAKLMLDLDCYGSETSWELRDTNGNILYSDGPFADDVPGLIEYTLCLSYDCYEMVIRDDYGDGLSGCSAAAGGNGYYKLTRVSNGVTLAEITEPNANFGSENIQSFCQTSTSSIDQIELENLITIYPNPGQNSLNVKAENVNLNAVRVYNVAGQEVLVEEVSGNQLEINTRSLPAAFYIVKIQTDKGELNQRWIKQ